MKRLDEIEARVPLARIDNLLYYDIQIYKDIADLLAIVKLQDETLKEVIRNSHDIVAKKLCSRTREEVEKILGDEV